MCNIFMGGQMSAGLHSGGEGSQGHTTALQTYTSNHGLEGLHQHQENVKILYRLCRLI